MIEKKSVTIGIAAYNEGLNIKPLLLSLFQQVEESFMLEKIVIIADGCTDDTVMQAYSTQIKKLELVSLSPRQGKANALNQIVRRSKTDILVLLDADVHLKDSQFIDRLIRPIIQEKAELTSAKVVPLPGKTFVAKVLYMSNEFKQEIYESWHEGNSIYTCHGRSIAMSRKLYVQMNYRNIIADDALAFITSKKLNYPYQYAKDAEVFYQLPQTIVDHQKQSSRFLQSQKQFHSNFDSQFINELYAIPKNVLIMKMISFLLRHPVNMTMYILLFGYLKLQSLFTKNYLLTWDIAKTSKV